jgi:NAD(P)-dependent dehydrogenase (short-subunit alcohol dehydrogenase family)
MPGPLEGQVALVAGATRGAGRGIAVELGAAGATVYCTGRTTHRHRSPYNRPETIEETAELVTAAGGIGVPLQVDHLDAEQVRDLVHRIDTEQAGRLDVLVNDIWGGDPFLGDFRLPFWDHNLPAGLHVLHNAVDTHIITSWHVAPLMIRRRRGLVVEITDGRPDEYHDHLFYDLPKKSVMRLAVTYAEEMGPHGVTGVAVSPGWLRSEAMLEGFGVTEDNWQDWYWQKPESRPHHWLTSESPRYTGRAVVALATDPEVSRWNGRTVYTRDLAAAYGFTDVNGTTPGHAIYSAEFLDCKPPRQEDYR